MTDQPDITTAAGRAQIAAAQDRLTAVLPLIRDADPNATPLADSTGPADPVLVSQDPDFEEVDVPDALADTSLADPAVQEV